MKLIIDIPTEFETDYNGDKFKDFFSRVLCDIDKGVMCGNYEKETAEMFLKAFDESVPMANIAEKLEERRIEYELSSENAPDAVSSTYRKGVMRGYEYSRDLVKQEINNGLE